MGQNFLEMNFLKQFWIIFKEFLHKSSDTEVSLLNPIVDTEPLGRYLLSKNYFSRQNNRVKYSAFMPPADLQLSVFRMQDLTEDDIWTLGEEEVVKKAPTPKTLYGRAEIIPLTVRHVGLRVDPDDTPPRHVSITGWPQVKSEQKLMALQLAEEAILKLRIQEGG
jgi:hypothetical protein